LPDRENQLEAPDVKISIITHLSRPPSENLLSKYARLYMSGFNQAPWDIYEYKYTAERARDEFRSLVFIVLSSGGALISLECGGKPAGFSVVTSLDVFERQLKELEGYPKLPPNIEHPGQYLETLSQLLKISQDEFKIIGYIADVVVDVRYRGKGYGKILVLSTLKYLKENEIKCALAWTVNPVMGVILSQEGFRHIDGIGNKGEGLDFTIHNGMWYPIIVMPAKRNIIQAVTPVVAHHYLKLL
jgi:ribosomal protein S18 acetylase RimI-like enzyme